jgi:hypothetical protein
MFVGAGALLATIALTPVAGASEMEIGDIGEGECRNPSASWDVSLNPVHVEADFDPGRICISATRLPDITVSATP